MRNLFLIVLLASAPVFAQEAPEDLPPLTPIEEPEAPATPPPSELQNDFRDPFTDPAGVEPSVPSEAPTTPSAPTAPAAPALEPPVLEAPALPSFRDPNESFNPRPTPPIPAPSQPDLSPRVKPFEFPRPEDQGPVTQDIILREQAERATAEGTFSLAWQGGLALNVNKSKNQGATELSLGYRITPEFELGLVGIYRYIRTTTWGLLIEGRYVMRLTDPGAFRIDLAPHAALGWLVRKRTTKFNEHRFPLRLGMDSFFYATESFAILLGVAMEAPYLAILGSKMENTFKGGGPPVQAILTGGVRFEF